MKKIRAMKTKDKLEKGIVRGQIFYFLSFFIQLVSQTCASGKTLVKQKAAVQAQNINGQ